MNPAMLRRVLLAVSLLWVVSPARAHAQGSLASQGFGYPPGQLSARAAATGGGLAEFDPLSAINPAALAQWTGVGLYGQYSPEFRSVTVNGQTDRSLIARFPLFAAGVPIGSNTVLGASASAFLDRSWSTSREGVDTIRGELAPFREASSSSGAINDIQLGLARRLGERLTVGVAGHVFPGENRRRRERTYLDSTTFASFVEAPEISFSGAAVSAGAQLSLGSTLQIAASGRYGGKIRAYAGDTLLSEGTIPPRYGAGIRYSGIGGAVLAARADWEGWSRIGPLAELNRRATDGWDLGAGAELKGPALLGSTVPVRIGIRRRTLPFSVDLNTVRETTLSAGAGLPFASDHGTADLTLQRAWRSGTPLATERAWILSIGFTVRP